MMGKTKPFGEVGDKMTDNAVLGFWQKAEITDQDLRITAEKPKNSHFAGFFILPKIGFILCLKLQNQEVTKLRQTSHRPPFRRLQGFLLFH